MSIGAPQKIEPIVPGPSVGAILETIDGEADGSVEGAVAELLDAESRLAAFVESSDDAIIGTHLGGVIMSWNAGAERLYGYSREEILGRHVSIVCPKDKRHEQASLIARLEAGEIVDHFETIRRRKDGTFVEVSITLAPIRDSTGVVVGTASVTRDSSERRRLDVLQSRLAAIVETADDAIFSVTLDGTVTSWNGGAERLFMIPGEAILGRDLRTIVPPDRSEYVAALLALIASGDPMERIESTWELSSGALLEISVRASAIRDASGTITGGSAIIHDISHRRQMESALRASEQRFRTLAENAHDLIFRLRLEPVRGVEFANQAFTDVTGYTPEELYDDVDALKLIFGADVVEGWEALVTGRSASAAGDIRASRKDGSELWLSQRIAPVRGESGRVVAIDAIARDVTTRKHFETQLEYDSLHDPLTGLANRVLLLQTLSRAITKSAASGGPVAVLYVDLDSFKLLNDTRGHAVGDAVLVEVARRLRILHPGSGHVGRISGDEFVVVCESLSGAADAVLTAERTLRAFDEPCQVDREVVHLSASIGVALARKGDAAEQLIRDADLAMYRAKQRGRGRFEVFDETLLEQASRRLSLESGLRHTLTAGLLTLEYQPIASLFGSHWDGAEALLRWRDPERGVVSPVEFIPIAEETGLMVPIGEYVLQTACAQLRAWRLPDDPPWSISVNVSPVQLRAPNFPAIVERALADSRLEPECLQLEVTESVLMADLDFFIRALRRLKDLGVRLSIDDFGTGYSSLSYLRHFPIDEIKVDRSFVSGLGSDEFNATLVAAVVSIANTLGVRVVAEGVETQGELDALRDLGCSHVQGYLLSHPVSGDACIETLRGPLPI